MAGMLLSHLEHEQCLDDDKIVVLDGISAKMEGIKTAKCANNRCHQPE